MWSKNQKEMKIQQLEKISWVEKIRVLHKYTEKQENCLIAKTNICRITAFSNDI